jgi:catechol 2,3-dioxygenase-like lactoylglutathione lyase family enzyme
MSIRRVVPDIVSTKFDESRAFYADFLGMRKAMDLGFIVTFVSPSNETAQVSIVSQGEVATPANGVALSIEVTDVDEMYARAREQGLEIVYPLTDEPWGVRRFFVRDPNRIVVNVMMQVPKPK